LKFLTQTRGGKVAITSWIRPTTVATVSKSKKKKIKKDKELDKDLKDTFPASDPITHY